MLTKNGFNASLEICANNLKVKKRSEHTVLVISAKIQMHTNVKTNVMSAENSRHLRLFKHLIKSGYRDLSGQLVTCGETATSKEIAVT